MQYLTTKQYRNLKGMSRQLFHKKKKAGQIPLVTRRMEKDVTLIAVEDTEMEGVNLEALTA